MHINTMRPAHNATVLLRERRAPQCGQALALVLTSPLHSGHFFTVIAAPSFRLTQPPAAIVGCGALNFLDASTSFDIVGWAPSRDKSIELFSRARVPPAIVSKDGREWNYVLPPIVRG